MYAGTMAATRLTKAAWIEGALAFIADVGVERLAVEPLAKRLATTKGSFYWHFASRDELLDAVLDHWLQAAAVEPAAANQAHSPRENLTAVLSLAARPGTYDQAEWRLLTSTHPRVQHVARQIHDVRQAFVRTQLHALGLPETLAGLRAHIGYLAYLGHLQMRVCTDASQHGPQGDVRESVFVDTLVTMLTDNSDGE